MHVLKLAENHRFDAGNKMIDSPIKSPFRSCEMLSFETRKDNIKPKDAKDLEVG